MNRITRITDVLSLIPEIDKKEISRLIEKEEIKINNAIASINCVCMDNDIVEYPNGKLSWKSEYFLRNKIER